MSQHLPIPTVPGEVTQLLRQWSEGTGGSLDPLFNLIYPRLRTIADALMRRESAESLLQPTAVVSELFVKLVNQHSLRFESREHFFSLAAALMRRILIDHARSRHRSKRDAGTRVELTDGLLWTQDLSAGALLDIDSALLALQAIDPRKSSMVEMRFFLGSSAEETAELFNTSKATVDREIKFARSWLAERLAGYDVPSRTR